MIGLGTIINIVAIVAGGIVGMTIGRFVTEKIQEALIICCGVSTMFIAIGGALKNMFVIENGSIATRRDDDDYHTLSWDSYWRDM